MPIKGHTPLIRSMPTKSAPTTFSVWYVTMNTRWMSVQINDNPANIICCDELTGNWNGVPSADRPGVASKTIRVWCREGENSMTLRPVYGYSPEEGRDQPYSPNVDRVVLEKVAVAMKEPAPWTEADRLKYESRIIRLRPERLAPQTARPSLMERVGKSIRMEER